MTDAATLERATIPRIEEYESVVTQSARLAELQTAHETAQRELARVTVDRADAQRRYRTLSDSVARGEILAEAPEWLDAKDQLRQLDERYGTVSLEVTQLRGMLDDCLIAGRAIRNEATRDRELQIRQQSTALAGEMVSLLEQLAARNSELIARIKIVGSVGRVARAIDPQLLKALISQLGGESKPISRRPANARAAGTVS